jgi:hypothetical protein
MNYYSAKTTSTRSCHTIHSLTNNHSHINIHHLQAAWQAVRRTRVVHTAAVNPQRPAAISVVSEPASAVEEPVVSLDIADSLSSLEDRLACVPEDYVLPPGVLSDIDRTSPLAPEDTYRCTGCTKPECQVRSCKHATSEAVTLYRLLDESACLVSPS